MTPGFLKNDHKRLKAAVAYVNYRSPEKPISMNKVIISRTMEWVKGIELQMVGNFKL